MTTACDDVETVVWATMRLLPSKNPKQILPGQLWLYLLPHQTAPRVGQIRLADYGSGFAIGEIVKVTRFSLRNCTDTLPNWTGQLSHWVIVRTEFAEGATPREKYCPLAADTDGKARNVFYDVLRKQYGCPRAELLTLPSSSQLATPHQQIQQEDSLKAECLVFRRLFPRTARIAETLESETDENRWSELIRQQRRVFAAEIYNHHRLQLDPSMPIPMLEQLAKGLRRKHRRVDEIDRLLAINWIPSKWNEMQPVEIAREIHKAIGTRLSPDAIKKRRERLGLVTERQPGRPAARKTCPN
ncbi:MAG: hypothetical protein HZC54_10700 [Verrucomicrobia bacterium]|nr:hypothetical protein [Verrucomicrobiota bacterium]